MATTVAPIPGAAPIRSTSYIPALDVVRIMALLGIMSTHAVAWAGRDTAEAALWSRALELLSRSGVSVFVLLSGVLLGYSSSRQRPPLEFLKHRFWRIGLPWMVWAIAWAAVFLFATDAWQRIPLPTLAEVVDALLYGPGYLYFLVLLGQLTLLAAVYPTKRSTRVWLAVAAAVWQLALNALRLVVADDWGGDAWFAIDTHAYELAPFWIGHFAVGVAAGGYLAALRRVSAWGRLATAAAFAVTAWLVVFAPGLGIWQDDRLNGASSLLHPLYLPLACAETLLLLWFGEALLTALPALTPAAGSLADASFGLYLIQQYPLEAIGPLFQHLPTPFNVSDQLPGSLLAVTVLLAVTAGIAAVAVALLQKTVWGRAVIGGNTGVRRPDPAPADG